MVHLDIGQILSDAQHGFLRKRSCEAQLIINLQDLHNVVDKSDETKGRSDQEEFGQIGLVNYPTAPFKPCLEHWTCQTKKKMKRTWASLTTTATASLVYNSICLAQQNKVITMHRLIILRTTWKFTCHNIHRILKCLGVVKINVNIKVAKFSCSNTETETWLYRDYLFWYEYLTERATGLPQCCKHTKDYKSICYQA